MSISKRGYVPEQRNAFSELREQLSAQGIAVTDLSDSNPTSHGLFDTALLEVVAAATERAAHYDPHPRGPLPAREALAARFGGSPEEYWLTASTSEAYHWLFTLLADPGDSLALPTPGYPLIAPLAHLAGLHTTEYRAWYLHPHGWEYDLDTLTHAAERSQVFSVVNPNNPTGAYLDEETSATLSEILARTGVPLIADEVFFPFALDTAAPRTRLADNVATVAFSLDGLSKLLAAPQLKLGWIRLTGPAAEIKPYARSLDAIADAYLPVGSAIAAALPTLLEHADAQVARITARLKTNLATAHTVFDATGCRVRHVAGGWMVLIDTPPLLADPDPDTDTDPDTDMALQVLRTIHLAAHPGWFYDLDSTNTLALSLLPTPATFTSHCQTLKAALA
ncbi:MAG: pyridoxal phosphate-dependent aminotransferase [Propionibacteriaceae bacterium]|nr:pyridoxal phosphate-dependent aminotransferase [Propionibacteriaceae bacterium]